MSEEDMDKDYVLESRPNEENALSVMEKRKKRVGWGGGNILNVEEKPKYERGKSECENIKGRKICMYEKEEQKSENEWKWNCEWQKER